MEEKSLLTEINIFEQEKLKQEKASSVTALELSRLENKELLDLKATNVCTLEQEKATLQAEAMTTKDNISEMSQKVKQFALKLEQEQMASVDAMDSTKFPCLLRLKIMKTWLYLK